MGGKGKMTVQVDGLDETMKVFRSLPKDIQAGADELVRDIARLVASEAQGAATTRAERKAATSIKAQKASVSIGSPSGAAGQMALGTEFGGQRRKTTMQFRPHRGRQGYFFWPSIRSSSERIKRMWDELVDGLIGGE
jgi:hypothetical protein